MLPTVTINGNYNRKGLSKTSGDGLATAVRRLRTPNARDYKSWKDGDREAKGQQIHLPAELGGRLSPLFVEQMMGYRTGWTELNVWATAWFRNARRKHSKG